jgi:uncharacterized membrane protein
VTPQNDDVLERRIGWILRAGVIASSTLLGAGVLLSFLSPAYVGQAILRAGLVVLVATPIARVAASAVSYFVSKDWMFVALTTVVLLELAAAVAAAIAG